MCIRDSPHIDPLIKAKKVKLAPIGAADLTNIPAILTLQTRFKKPKIDIVISTDSAKIADGTWI